MSTGSLGGHGLADRQYCFHLHSSVTEHARFYKIIVVFSMLWYTDSKRTGNPKERKNYHADTRITTAANLITAAAASLEHPVPGRCRPGRDAEKEEIDNPLFDLDKIHGTVERPISVQTPDKEGNLSERAAPGQNGAGPVPVFGESAPRQCHESRARRLSPYGGVP